LATTQNTWADPITVTLQGRQNTFHIAAHRDIFVPAIVENLGPNPVTIVTPPTRLVLEGNESAAYVVFMDQARSRPRAPRCASGSLRRVFPNGEQNGSHRARDLRPGPADLYGAA
jgi:hypothetical protein